jgi:hypothetical protein
MKNNFGISHYAETAYLTVSGLATRENQPNAIGKPIQRQQSTG